nr:MAG TPA: hypothetical protein [Caudoviricetes sp.]
MRFYAKFYASIFKALDISMVLGFSRRVQVPPRAPNIVKSRSR